MAIKRRLTDRRRNQTFSRIRFIYTLNGLPTDLSGVSIESKFRHKNNCGPVVKTITDLDGITITDAAGGLFEIDKFTPITFEPALYYFDIEITFPNGDVKTWVECSFKVLEDRNK